MLTLGHDLKTREPVTLEAAHARVLLICGKRGSGKSYTLGVLAEELFQQEPRPCALLVDPVGSFWTLAQAAFGSAASSKPQATGQTHSLQSVAWSLQHSQGLPITLLVPGDPASVYPDALHQHFASCGITITRLTLNPAELSPDAWCELFALSINEPLGIALARAMQSLAGSTSCDLAAIEDALQRDPLSQDRTKEALLNRLSIAKSWGLFVPAIGSRPRPWAQSAVQTPAAGRDVAPHRGAYGSATGLPVGLHIAASDVTAKLTPERLGVVDLSTLDYGPQGLRSLVLAVLARRLFTHHQRLRQQALPPIGTSPRGNTAEGPPGATRCRDGRTSRQLVGGQAVVSDAASLPKLWLLIDEAHQFIPQGSSTLAKDALIRWVKEGRQPGLSCVLASQQPGSLDQDVLSQCDALISHKLTNLDDLQALNRLSQAYMGSELKVYLRYLKAPGQAVLVDDARERVKLLQVRERLTRHGGGEL